jgi:phospho-N-acetylmuramoyl-pentapeptide-transferase
MNLVTASWPLLATMALAIALGGPYIDWLQRARMGQSIREEGPESHRAKAGTPTMGGWIFVVPAMGVLLAAGWRNPDAWALAAVVMAHAAIGGYDDWLIIRKQRNLGLTARQKLILQIAAAGAYSGYLLWKHPGPALILPFTHAALPLGWLFPVWGTFVMTGTSNAVNLTDGLDGLAASTAAIAFAGLALAGVTTLGWSAADPGVIAALALAGGCLGFLWFNGHPARVFMGDTGSLALGSALAAIALSGHAELWLLVIGGVFVAETLSVIAQVTSFKTTGKRIFKMSPLHHHFELSGWAETQVVQRFGLVAIALAIAAIAWF